jgi:hypothetical protein
MTITDKHASSSGLEESNSASTMSPRVLFTI